MKSFRIFSALVILTMLVSFVPASAASEAAPLAEPTAPDATRVPLNPFSAGPSYDSGWRSIAPGQTLTLNHNLLMDPTMMFVQLDERDFSAINIEQRFVGGNDMGTKGGGFGGNEDRVGAYWHNLTNNDILVTRQPEDTLVDAVRVRIWGVGSGADYSSGWSAIPAGQSEIFTHNLGGNIDDYVVDMMFKDATVGGLGVNQRAYGGRTLGMLSTFFGDGARMGAYWYGLATNVTYVYRMPEDDYADQVLMRIWKRQRPTYDSGWVPMDAGSYHNFYHNIGGSPEDYRVDMEFWTAIVPLFTNQCFYGGNDVGPLIDNLGPNLFAADNDRLGAFWFGLDYDSITVYRRPEDSCAGKVRIRIWNFWTPTRPDYDSGWKPVIPGGVAYFTPNITDSFDPYLVDLQFKDFGYLSIGIHQRGLGGMDWTNGSRVGGYWYDVNGTLLLDRRLEDADAPYIRARIWKMPKPAYDSGWQSIPGLSLLFDHNLGSNPADYLVDMQFKDSVGNVHQMGYGAYEVTDGMSPDYGYRLGAFWDWLDDTHIEVRRKPEETHIASVRVRIWTLARPDYDSNMVNTEGIISTTLIHNLGRRPEDYLLNLVLNDPDIKLLHQRYYGGAVIAYEPAEVPNVRGDQVGAFYRNLDSDSVQFVRNPNEAYTEEFRLRLWVVKQLVHIPAVKK